MARRAGPRLLCNPSQEICSIRAPSSLLLLPELSLRPRRKTLLIAGMAAVVVFAVVRVSLSPVSIPVSGWIAERLTSALGAPVFLGPVGVQLEFGAVALTVDDVRVRTDVYSASIQRISVLQGFTGRSVRLKGPAVRLDPSQGQTGSPPPVPHPDAAIQALDAGLGAIGTLARENGLHSLNVEDGRLDIVSAGRPINEARVFQAVSADFQLSDPAALSGRIEAVGADGTVSTSVTRMRDKGGARTLTLALNGMTPKDITRVQPVRSGLAIDAAFTGRLSEDGAVMAADLDVSVGPGVFVFGKDPPRAIDRAGFTLTRADDGASFRLHGAQLDAGNTHVALAGTLVPSQDPAAMWDFSLETSEAIFDAPDVNLPPVVPSALTAVGRLDLEGRAIHFDAVRAAAQNGSFDGIFTFDYSEKGPTLTGAARIGPSTIATLLGAWPPVVAHEPRTATLETVLGGMVGGAEFQFALTPLELDGDPATNDMIEGGLSVDLSFVGATFATPELPVAVGKASGAMRLRDKAFSVRIDRGVIGAGEGGTIAVSDGRFTIRDLAASPPEANLSATLEGPVSAVVSLAHELKVPELKKTPLTPDDVEGTIKATVSLNTPLADDVPDEARRWSIDARLTNAGSKVPIAGQTFTDANVEVLINRLRLAARGRAKIDGLTVDVNYSEIFDGEKSGAARFVLTDKDRRARGFDTGATLTGPVTVTLEQGAEETNSFTADLTEAAVALPVYAKRAGTTLTAAGDVRGEAPELSIDNLRVTGRNVRIEGAVDVRDGALARASFGTFALAEGDDARIEVSKDGNGLTATFDAAQFDARQLLKGLKTGSTAGTKPQNPGADSLGPLTVNADVARLRISDVSTVAGLTVAARYAGNRVQKLSASGKLDDVNAGSFAVEIGAAENRTRRMQVDIAELGRLLSAFDIYKRMRGGRTKLDARLDDDGVISGRLVADQFVLTNEKSLEKILQQARASNASMSATSGTARVRSNQAIDGMSFERLAVDFTKRGDIISVNEAIVRGPIMGGSASGVVDLSKKSVLLNGTLIPAYGVNNLFGRVPLVGTILGGGNKGGLFGVTFRLVGPIDNPQLVLNPMSAIAPGIFRKIFEFR
ncbi:AsmA-like C-terminal region-containing protein [Acuticoccus sp. MNP-M23]|uniref:AsmA-like C-terminal region-containing protein n=1 Tax=Acuticoccus sp. MNP-M23 TaxID=3072793 RepID=UPI00281507FF|nr:AsmA-like C-terminal region-containing protein [Acuticoccus sp. MNP-M23]WMS42536.1 AsmA-like C-terminal region-containing protein [Acuticoccus sp. MNP-M23]